MPRATRTSQYPTSTSQLALPAQWGASGSVVPYIRFPSRSSLLQYNTNNEFTMRWHDPYYCFCKIGPWMIVITGLAFSASAESLLHSLGSTSICTVCAHGSRSRIRKNPHRTRLSLASIDTASIGDNCFKLCCLYSSPRARICTTAPPYTECQDTSQEIVYWLRVRHTVFPRCYQSIEQCNGSPNVYRYRVSRPKLIVEQR
ncbi:hypothetical protein B0F90DRAFT_416726 [Multifurca ochricompacta]|uniref:Uncharacterized protein n=1 Tax=Multifurca ochricompacta TaxID=376703 RepID=A0AAD4M3G0_9AGAM|nr:hypothetical protein B0F90DRAFT_416726 [Multifurca ochricompacta]